MSHHKANRWDVFCRIVDNFGDIGVCWRLSQQLACEYHLQVRLFIDDLAAAIKIIPALNCELNSQIINHVEILTWQSAITIQPADVALETFSCELPADYLAAMQGNTVWVNLEYLSAESWVADFHARSSNNTKPARHFFFPGFTEATGGLIREADIFQNNQLTAKNKEVETGVLKVSLFCYPHAPVSYLLNAMAESNQPVDCYVPNSSILPAIADFFNLNTVETGSKLSTKNLTLHVLPFLSQADYDKLLVSCDINFVRGEDSWIRAIWAGKPFIWQPYLQTENTHITKLNAFLDLFYAEYKTDAKAAIYNAHSAWSTDDITTEIWQSYLQALPVTKPYTLNKASELATQTDLASKLVIFLQKL
ncbi:MAG: elongation factor P maturation arginine rhamnosyltransferase EarP [Methylotenera sp.]|uniref:elongation factor P maturation arginine rhamnosyltransferase EarP n=1 Tax=Methylotenera sp. TaxID=2051956 RepID=UPI0024878C9C|nr:elongation factor P maturation arginine rhamnosyltransferase EarP [Methylotenera sp.]MDI1309605.1 elongation factor P maturation arginine rhamnosyltransferase EarP [Methylotenera sp.]